jgi:DNA-binding YbaB/EbfC family protein
MFSKKDLKGFEQKYQALNSQMDTMQEEGIAGAGLVKARVNGRMELIELHIKPDCIDPQEAELLQDLIKSAIQQAQQQIQTRLSQIMPMGGMGGF